jgi:chromosomal replication initiation ATPase DnaA
MRRVTALLADDVNPADVLRQRPPTFREIMQACAEHYNVEMDHLLGGGSDREATTARNCAFYIGRRYTRHSCEEMAFAMGRRTHHPCTTALTKMSGRLQVEERLRDDIDIIERRIAQTVLDWRFMPCR